MDQSFCLMSVCVGVPLLESPVQSPLLCILCLHQLLHVLCYPLSPDLGLRPKPPLSILADHLSLLFIYQCSPFTGHFDCCAYFFGQLNSYISCIWRKLKFLVLTPGPWWRISGMPLSSSYPRHFQTHPPRFSASLNISNGYHF